MTTKASVIWLIKDNEGNAIREFSCNTTNWRAALLAYLKWLDPNLPPGDFNAAVDNFNGEIWPANLVEHIDLRRPRNLP